MDRGLETFIRYVQEIEWWCFATKWGTERDSTLPGLDLERRVIERGAMRAFTAAKGMPAVGIYVAPVKTECRWSSVETSRRCLLIDQLFSIFAKFFLTVCLRKDPGFSGLQ